jgi:hypothetical protein
LDRAEFNEFVNPAPNPQLMSFAEIAGEPKNVQSPVYMPWK